MALTKCTQIKKENVQKDNLIENLRTQIKEWQSKYSNSTLTIEQLAEQLSKQPAFISTHDWKITTLITTLAVILTVFFMAEISE